jgi:hypothetical protein
MKALPVKELRALDDHVLVADMNFDTRILNSGIMLLNDDLRSAGIRPRWAQVYAIGPNQEDIQVGQWVLVAHGRWTRGVRIQDNTGEHTLRRIDPQDVLLLSDSAPTADENMSDAVLVESQDRW